MGLLRNISSSTAKFLNDHFRSTYPFSSLGSLVTSLDIVYICFWLSINISPTTDTTLSLGIPRALAGATARSHQLMVHLEEIEIPTELMNLK
jgi:hypothetical protein